MTDLTEALADRTPWSITDVIRELGMSPLSAVPYAARSYASGSWPLGEAFPAPLPGSPRPPYLTLCAIARGRVTPAAGPQWAAGDIRLWGMQTARLDHELKVLQQRPTQSPRRRPDPRFSY